MHEAYDFASHNAPDNGSIADYADSKCFPLVEVIMPG
jgi:hypothetical protein